MTRAADVARPRRRAAIVGAARDCARHLPRVLDNLGRIAQIYAETFFVFAVSDSSDDTFNQLETWVANGRNGRVVDLGTLESTVPVRTARIACARNACLDAVRESIAAEYDHLIVVDLDDVLDGDLAIDAVEQAADWLDAAPERAGVFANAAPRYYDIWALRHESWCPDDCWHAIWGRPADRSFEAAKFRESLFRQIVLPAAMPPIAVQSAFGGLGLYKMLFARQGTYCGVDPQDRPVSEHVAFNETIRKAGGLLHIFPSLIVQAPRQHLYSPDEFSPRWRLRMQLRHLAERMRPPWRALVQDER